MVSILLIAGALFQGLSFFLETAQEIADSTNVIRTCAIEFDNYHNYLQFQSPNFYEISGTTQNPPPPIIRPAYREVTLFRKIAMQARGTVGVLTYDIQYIPRKPDIVNGICTCHCQRKETPLNTGYKLIVMWHVPWSYVNNRNFFAVGVRKSASANSKLFWEMRNKGSRDFVRANAGQSIHFKHQIFDLSVNVHASMSTAGRSVLTIAIQ